MLLLTSFGDFYKYVLFVVLLVLTSRGDYLDLRKTLMSILFYYDSFFLLLLFVINFQVFIWKEKPALQAITECKQQLHAT